MANNKFMDRFFEWQYYVHYIFLALLFSGTILYFKLYGLETNEMFIWTVALLFIFDTIIHYMFWKAPKPIRWRD